MPRSAYDMRKIEEVKRWSQEWPIAAGAYPGFCSMKRLKVFLLPLDGMLVHRRLVSPTICRYPFIHLGGERHCDSSVLPKNTTQCPRPGLEPGPLAPESSALTMRPPQLPHLNLTFAQELRTCSKHYMK